MIHYSCLFRDLYFESLLYMWEQKDKPQITNDKVPFQKFCKFLFFHYLKSIILFQTDIFNSRSYYCRSAHDLVDFFLDNLDKHTFHLPRMLIIFLAKNKVLEQPSAVFSGTNRPKIEQKNRWFFCKIYP